MLWPYIEDIRLYACPRDPQARKRGEVPTASPLPGAAFDDAPPLSYGLNTLLFRTMPAIRRMAGASWGLGAGEFAGDTMATTQNDQQRWIPSIERRVLFFCGLSGFPVGHQSAVVWRDSGLSGTTRSEWHPSPGPEPFQDSPRHGSHYLFWGGEVEYRQEFPSRFEWALDLK
jgi:hypothetical protein